MYASRSWWHRHPYATTGVRITTATWNVVIGIVLLAHGYQWGAALLVVAALILGAAYTLARGNSGSGYRGHGQNGQH